MPPSTEKCQIAVAKEGNRQQKTEVKETKKTVRGQV